MKEISAYFGRMNDPTASAWITGICGDRMEFYLYIRDDVIEEIKFYTENGCADTKTAGIAVAKCAEKKKIMDALKISPGAVLDSLDFFSGEGSKISEDGRHCAILAVSTLYKAIAEYLLMP